MASFLRRQDNLETLKTRNLFLQGVTGAYPPDQSILTISGNLGQVVTTNSITVQGLIANAITTQKLFANSITTQSLFANSITTQSLSTCQLIAANGKFKVDCITGQLDMYRPGLTIGGVTGQNSISSINLHGGITGGTTAQQYILQMKIQAEPNDISGVPMSSTMGFLGIADASGNFAAPVIGLDASANKMRIIQYFSGQGNIPAVTIDNVSAGISPLNQAPHCGRVTAHEVDVDDWVGVNVYYNPVVGVAPIQPFGNTTNFGGAILRHSHTSQASPFPAGGGIDNDRYPSVITAYTGTTAVAYQKRYNLITMDVSAGFIGVLNTRPAYTLDVSGSVNITRNLTVLGTKLFSIPHPLSPAEKRLVFCAIEGPRCDLIYRGRVALTAGIATVPLDTQSTANGTNGMTPGTFSALARNPQVYLQNNETFDAVKGSVQGDTLTIQCANPSANATIDWMVVAERQDAGMYGNSLTDSNGYLVNEHPAAP